MLYLQKYCHIYVLSIYLHEWHIEMYTHQMKTNRKNPNVIIYSRMSFLVIFIYYTLCNLRPTYSSLHARSFVMSHANILCLDSFPHPLLLSWRTLKQPEDQLKVNPSKLRGPFLCSHSISYINLRISHIALPHGSWTLTSWIRDWTLALSSDNMES